MKKLITGSAILGLAAGVLAAQPVQAAPKQYVILVSEGLSPKVLDLGRDYIRKADDDAEASTAFETLTTTGKAATAAGAPDLNGVLATAAANGYKTGLVTTAPVLTDAAAFYGVTADPAAVTATKFDFLAGGGRAGFSAAQLKSFADGGNSYIANEAGIDAEIKGRVLALQSDGELSYGIDRNPEAEAGLGELTSLAIDTLSANDSPFVLIVHDTLIKKAIEKKDSPAVFEQFREDNSILNDALNRRDDMAGLAVGALWTGGVTPRFTTTVDAEIANSYFILSNLGNSFSGTTAALKGADADKITDYIDSDTGVYKGWKLSPATRQGIINGTIVPETAARASYEPVLKLTFDGPAGQAGAATIGFEAPQGLGAALKAAVATPAK